MPALPQPSGRPRLLVFNQYYFAGVEATAQLLTELCEALTSDYDVTVVTGRLHHLEDVRDYEIRNGVEIIRAHSTAYDRALLQRRAANYLTYPCDASGSGCRSARPSPGRVDVSCRCSPANPTPGSGRCGRRPADRLDVRGEKGEDSCLELGSGGQSGLMSVRPTILPSGLALLPPLAHDERP